MIFFFSKPNSKPVVNYIYIYTIFGSALFLKQNRMAEKRSDIIGKNYQRIKTKCIKRINKHHCKSTNLFLLFLGSKTYISYVFDLNNKEITNFMKTSQNL